MMPILMDKILREYADQAYDTARLGRNGLQTAGDLVRRKMLADLEARSCDAVRKFTRSNCVEGDTTAARLSHGPSARCGGRPCGILTMLGREPTAIPFSAEAMRASLLRLQSEWETYQTTRDRDGVYGYLSAVFETVMAWTLEGRAVNREVVPFSGTEWRLG